MASISPVQPVRSRLLMALIAALGVGLGAGASFVHRQIPQAWPGTIPPRQAERDTVEALGRLQPAGGVISVPGPPGDRVEKLFVTQGQAVKKDQPLVRLASWKDRQDEEELARRQYEEARAQKEAIGAAGAARLALIDAELAQASGGRAQEIAAQRARIGVLEAQRDHAQRLARRKISPELLVRQADGELEAARALLEKTKITYDRNDEALRAKSRAAQAETEQARARVPLRSLEQAHVLAKRKAELGEIKAPVAGTVLKVNVSNGDSIGRGSLLELAGGQDMIAVAEVYETDVPLLREWLRQGPVEAEVSASALGKTIRATLTKPEQIARLISRNALMSLSPRADVDRRVIEVKVDLESPAQVEHLVGLQVNVRFRRHGQP